MLAGSTSTKLVKSNQKTTNVCIEHKLCVYSENIHSYKQSENTS